MSLPVEHVSVAFRVRQGRGNRFMFHVTLLLVSEDLGDVRQLWSKICVCDVRQSYVLACARCPVNKKEYKSFGRGKLSLPERSFHYMTPPLFQYENSLPNTK